MLILLVVASYAATEPTFCFCEDSNCTFDMFFCDIVLDPSYEYNINYYYKQMMYAMGREKNITLLFSAKSEESNYSIQLPLTLFINRMIELKYIEDAPKPTIRFLIESHTDYSSTSIINHDYLISIYYTDSIAKNLTLYFDTLINTYESTTQFHNQQNKFALICNNLISSSSFLKIFDNIKIKKGTITNKIIFTESISYSGFFSGFGFNFTSSEGNISIRIYEETSFVFERAINCYPQLIVSNSNIRYPTYIFLTFRNIPSIFIKGNWLSCSSIIIVKIQNVETQKIFIDGYLFCQKSIKAAIISLTTTSDAEIYGKIIYSKSFNLSTNSTRKGQINVIIDKVNGTGIFFVKDARLNIMINKCIFPSTTSEFPISPAISSDNISKITVKNMKVESLEHDYVYTFYVSNQMTVNPKDEDILFLLTGKTNFMTIPYIPEDYYSELLISFTDDSIPLHGFNNDVCVLELKPHVDVSTQTVSFFTFGEKPSTIPSKICIGDEIDMFCGDMNVFIVHNSSDLNSNYNFDANINNYEILVSNTATSEIGFQNIETKGNTFNLVVPDDSRIYPHLVFPSEKDIITNIIFSGSSMSCLIGKTKIKCHRFEVKECNTSVDDFLTFEPDFDVDEIVSDVQSLPLINRSNSINNLIVKIEIPYNFVHIENNAISFGTSIDDIICSIPWNKLGNLTLEGKNIILFNSAKSNVPSFNIICNEDSILALSNKWEEVHFEKSMKVYCNNFSINIILHVPFMSEEIEIIDGKSTIYLDYKNTTRVCLYEVISTECSMLGFDQSITIQDYDEAALLGYDSIEYYISSTSQEHTFDLSVFNRKQVSFTSAKDNEKINICIIPPSSFDKELTFFIFKSCNVRFDDNISVLNLGYVKFEDSNVFAQDIDLVADHLNCSYCNMDNFKSIVTNHQLFLTSELVDSFSEVIIKGDNKCGSLCLILPDNIEYEEIVFASSCVKLRNMQFHLPISDDFSVILMTMNADVIEFKCEPNSTNVPKCKISSELEYGSYFTPTFRFKGDWPMNGHKFNITFTEYLIVETEAIINGDIYGKGVLYFDGSSEKCGITGKIQILYHEIQGNFPQFYVGSTLNSSDRVHLYINELVVTYNLEYLPLLKFLSASVSFHVHHITNIHNSYQKYIINSIFDKDGSSQLIVETELDKNEGYDTLIQVDYVIEGPLLPKSEYAFFTSNFTFMIAPIDDILMPESFISTYKTPTHGLDHESFGMDTMTDENNFRNIYIYLVVDPYTMPFRIYYERNFVTIDDYDFITTPDISDCFINMSAHLHDIDIIFYESMIDEQLFPLSKLAERFVDITVRFRVDTFLLKELTEPMKISFDEPGNGVSKIIIEDMLKLAGNQKITFKNIKKLEMGKILIDPVFLGKEIKNLEYLSSDVTTFYEINQVADIDLTRAHLNLTYVHYITFEEFGWIFQNDRSSAQVRIKKKNISRMSVMCESFIRLSIDKPFDQRMVAGLVIETNCTYNEHFLISFDEGWDTIAYFDNLNIISQGVISYKISTISVPLPEVFNNHQRLNYELDPLYSKQYSISSSIPLQESYVFDMTGFVEPQQIIKSSRVKIIDNCSLTFINNIGQFDFSQILITNNVEFTIRNLKIREEIIAQTKSSSLIENATISENANIEIHWNKDEWATIRMIKNAYSTNPKSIKIILDDLYPFYNEYYNYTYKRSFVIISGLFGCQTWIDKIEFIADDPHFQSGEDLIFATYCRNNFENDEESLIVYGEKELPIDKDPDSTESEDHSILYTVCIVIIVVSCAIIGVIVHIVTKCKYQRLFRELQKDKIPTKTKFSTKVRSNKNDFDDHEYEEEDINNSEIIPVSQLGSLISNSVIDKNGVLSYT